MNLWFKIFFRNAKKNWLNISINILGLTLGLAGLIVVLLYINDEESYNKWNPNKDNIYRASLLYLTEKYLLQVQILKEIFTKKIFQKL